MEFVNSEMKKLIDDMSSFDDRLKAILMNRTTMLSTDFIEFKNMVLWNEKNRTIEQIENLQWDYRMKLWEHILSHVEFLGWNIIELNDYFSDLCRNDVVSIGYFCFQYWKSRLKKEFPYYHFFIRFCFQEYDDGDIKSFVSFHKIRFNEEIGASALVKETSLAVMFAII